MSDNTKQYLVVTVDTNDGDYETTKTAVDTITDLSKSLTALGNLPKEQNYHYDRKMERVETGLIVKFKNKVGECQGWCKCGLKSLVMTDKEVFEYNYTPDDIKVEGCITEDEYNVLWEILPMVLDDGFHTIISVTLEEHTVLESYL